MEALLDFNAPFNVSLLDQIIDCLYSSRGNIQEIQMAQKVLSQFKDDPNSWTRVKQILETSNNQNSKFFALQVLLQVIQTRWKILPPDERDGVKNFIVLTVINCSKDETYFRQHKLFINKLNEVLVAIVKQEWPQNWRNFIPEIVNSSPSNENLCENNMNILKLLSEEVFDFSAGKMTTKKMTQMSESFRSEFKLIYQLCDAILQQAQKPSLLSATLQTLLRFLNWIPREFIFETSMLEILITKFLPVQQFRNDTLRCLTEIVSMVEPKYDEKFELIFVFIMRVIPSILPPNTNLPSAYKNGSDYDQKFVQILGLFFTSFLTNHLGVVEKDQHSQIVLEAHQYLVEISKVDETEIFKNCLDYWIYFSRDLYFSEKKASQSNIYEPLLLTRPASARKAIYSRIMSQVRLVMVSKMAKPEEVIIVEDENGQVVKEYMKDVDSIQLYKSMRDALIYLTHLDYVDTEKIMLEKLRAQANGYEWSRQNLNTLCWAIGSISGAMDEKDEKRFVVTVIKDLLNMCEMKKGKDNKAVVASNIMYVVGQYPRFLIAHWKFLQTVVNKLFEFMHEKFPGVQEMACETFVKISIKCKRKFVQRHQGEDVMFLEKILRNLKSNISDLEPSHIHTFYEAVGYMIQAALPADQERLIQMLMSMPNSKWQSIMNMAAQNVATLADTAVLKELANILKTNVSASKSIGNAYLHQMKIIFKDMLNVYKAYSQFISDEIAKIGVKAATHSNVRMMRAVKRETLKLVETFIANSDDTQLLVTSFLPPLLDATLGDYKASVPDAKDPQVLSLLSASMVKLQTAVDHYLPTILEYVLECTLPMITTNFEDYPEHRMNLFVLLKSINKYCFQSFLHIPPMGFKLIVDSILWALKHTHRNMFETGLNILQDMLSNIEHLNNDGLRNEFYGKFYLPILDDVLYIYTDTLHQSGFKVQTTIIHHLLYVVATNKITAPISEGQTVSTDVFVKQHIHDVLIQSFSNLNSQYLTQFIVALFGYIHQEQEFTNCLRDFLVTLREYQGEDVDVSDLYFEEKQKKEIESRQLRESVPGLDGPSAVNELAQSYDDDL
ncbi:exportin-1 [Naegleria gruberi]|uniref:Exportin-1 n=1 Tax=Naegleria gruberi TaxID=5762 RepID=D2V758_NAEGR|nr:exportin-1 [Naegleria gruberi]EFC47202.1 exportin-1 [Naegleria gruberi]|eukprot:XP_002679946.1 exportin-1 [Naegleria gruberi]